MSDFLIYDDPKDSDRVPITLYNADKDEVSVEGTIPIENLDLDFVSKIEVEPGELCLDTLTPEETDKLLEGLREE